jgi:biotin synthase
MFTKDEIIGLLEERDAKVVEALYGEANRVRTEYVGDEIHLRGLIEFSNYCRRDCLYCGLRRSNRNAIRYRLGTGEIFDQALLARDLGFKTVVLQSGEDPDYTVQELCALVERIKTELGLAITLCIGERPYDDYKRLKDAGTDRYLLRFETSSSVLFRALKPDSDYGKRFRCLEWLRKLGYQVGSGNMVGLPGQSLESLADDILKFKEMDLDMIGLGPYISHPETPLHGSANGTIDMVLRVTALTRIITKNAHMPATTATGTIDPEGRQKALQCGANVLMPNLTPPKYREHYLIYPDKICIGEEPRKCCFCVEAMAVSLGRTVARDAGHSLKALAG